jgi:hypothetical protein
MSTYFVVGICVKTVTAEETGSLLIIVPFLSTGGNRSDIPMFGGKASLSHDIVLVLFEGHVREVFCVYRTTSALKFWQVVLWQNLAVKWQIILY